MTSSKRFDFVIVSFGTMGDVLPFIAVAQRLQRQGRRVTVVTNEQFRSSVARAGVPMVAVGDETRQRRIVEAPHTWTLRRGLTKVFQGLFPDPMQQFELLVEQFDPSAMILIAHPFAMGCRLVQQCHGTLCATVVLSPCLFRSVHQVPVMVRDWELGSMARPLKRLMWWLADRLLIDPAVTPQLKQACRQLGLDSVDRPFDGWMFSPDLTVGLFPHWFAPPQPDWPGQVELAGFPQVDTGDSLPEKLDEFINSGEPPVVATTGSIPIDGRRFVAPFVKACRRIGLRGVIVGTDTGVLADDEQFCFTDFAPFGELFAHCRAVVHHGGIGTTAAALRAGIPQIVRPVSFDHPDHAARIVRLNIGRRLLPDAFSAPRLTTMLEEVLSNSTIQQACTHRANQPGATEGIERTCQLLVHLPPSPDGPRG